MISPHRPPDVYADLRAGTDVVRVASYILRELVDEARDRYHPETIRNMRALGETLISAGEGVVAACDLAQSSHQGTLFDPNDMQSTIEIAYEDEIPGEADIYEFEEVDEVAA